MQYRDKLISGLREIEDMLLERVHGDEGDSEAFLTAAGYLCGYIQNEIPMLEAIPDELMDEFDKVTTEYLNRRDAIRKAQADE